MRVPIINAFRLAATVAFAISVIAPALAHHGGGTFDNTRTIELKGTLTRLELINPHSWILAFVDHSRAAANRK